jgi:hypothetical protein
MRRCFLTPLALWYLLVPPLTHDVPPTSDPHAPLSRWEVQSTHASARDCEDARRDFDAMYGAALVFDAQCVSANDPRLAGADDDDSDSQRP